MSERLHLTLFAHVCARPEAEIDVAEAALLIGDESPGPDVAHYVHALDELGAGARAVVSRAGSDEAKIERAVRFVYDTSGFHGNGDDYYDPRNSFLHEVIDRRTGIPITLALVLTEICRRAGIEARGVSFPGHFLVRTDTPRGTIIIDPFAGRPLSRDELRALYARSTGAGERARAPSDDRPGSRAKASPEDPPARLLEPATKVQILARILQNLQGIYESRHDDERLRSVLSRVQVLTPSEGVRRRLEELGGGAPWPSTRSAGRGLN
jgi:regulator of sirC expression with transglutaminase-like and TPR domain